MNSKVTQSRKLHLTPELVAMVDRTEPDPGPEPGTSDHTDEEFHALVETLLNEYAPTEFWIFAYGSLLWNPEFKYEETRPAEARMAQKQLL
jgi:cation transport protein ChaC